jgi:Arc/MetJ family transcription regulator
VRTTIAIDDSLLRRAMQRSGNRTEKATVEAGRRLLVEIKAQEKIRLLRGKVRREGSGDRRSTSSCAKNGSRMKL